MISSYTRGEIISAKSMVASSTVTRTSSDASVALSSPSASEGCL